MLFDYPLSKYLIFKKNFLHVMAVLGYLPKLKRGLGLAFGALFWHNFSIKMLLNTLSMDEVTMSYLFSFPRYQAKCVINPLSAIPTKWSNTLKQFVSNCR